MELVTLLLLIIVVEELSLFLWMKFVLKGLKFERFISQETAYVGDIIDVKVVSYNYKVLPIPWIRYTEDIPHHMLVHGPKLDETNSKLNNDLITVTSLFSFQKITRRYKLEPVKRGDYFFRDVHLEIGDYFGAHKRQTQLQVPHRLVVYPKVYALDQLMDLSRNPQGDVSVKRWIMPDPIDIIGVRPYTGSESFNTIDWQATAKTNSLQVRQYDFHADPSLMILLSLQTNEVEWFERNNEMAEQLILIAASIVEKAVSENIGVGLSTTATLSSGETLKPILPKRHKKQKIVLLDALAKASYYNTVDYSYIINQAGKLLNKNQSILLVAVVIDQEAKHQINLLLKKGYNVVIVTLDHVNLEDIDSKVTTIIMSNDAINNLEGRAI